MDVSTEGTLAKTMVEEVSQSYEIVDFDCSLPGPTLLGKSPKPDLDEGLQLSEGEDQESGSSTEDDPEDDNKARAKKNKSRKRAGTNTPDKKRSKRAKAEQEHQLEEALEAWG